MDNYLDNFYESNNLKGKVKTLLEKNYFAETSLGIISKGESFFEYLNLDFFIVFNIQNKIIEYTSFESDCIVEKVVKLIYDENNLKREEIVFDSANFMIEKTNFIYDTNMKIIECNKFRNNQILIENKKFFYNEQNQLIEITTNNRSGKLINTIKYKHNKFGCIEREFKDYSEDMIYTIINKYEFNDIGLIDKKVEINKYSNNTDENRTIFIYTSDKKIIIEYVNQNRKLPGYFNCYKYDKFGNITKKTIVDIDFNFIFQYEYSYIYDLNNNWTTKIEYENSIPWLITEREISYY